MSQDRTRLLGVVEALARRERDLIRRGTALRAALLVAVAFGLAFALARLDVARPVAATWLVLWLGLGGLALIAVPWRSAWRSASDLMRQARLLEAIEPELRGRLVTVVAHREGVRGAESEVLLELAARRAVGPATRHLPERVHPGRDQRGWQVAALVGVVAVAGLWASAPGGLSGTLRWWTDGAMAGGEAGLDGELAMAPAHVGDLTLRYVYPDYTGLEPYEVVNSTGEAHAPPGTRVEVSARSADVVDGAALRAYDGPAVEATVRGGRFVQASFLVHAEPGVWRLITAVGGSTRSSKAFNIVPEPDAPPQVVITSGEGVVEVAVDEPIQLSWTAADDYGLTKVLIHPEGREPRALRVVLDRQRSLDDKVMLRPVDLGLAPGDDVGITIVAWDNDAVAGSKSGKSNTVRLVVLGEDGSPTLDAALTQALLDLSLDALAAYFVETFPPGPVQARWSSWGELVNERYAPISALVEKRMSKRRPGAVWSPVVDALESARTLVRYTQTSFVPGDQGRVDQASATMVTALRDDATLTLQDAILHLDAILRRDAFDAVVASVGELQERARALASLLAQGELSPVELSVQRELTERLVSDVAAAAGELSRGGLQDFVSTRMDEARALLDELVAAQSEGRKEDARARTHTLRERLDETAEGIREELERMKEESQRKGSEQAELADELKAIALAQDELAKRLAELRREEGEASRTDQEALWKRLEAEASNLVALLGRMESDLEGQQRSFNERTLVGAASGQAGTVLAGARAHDALGAYRAAIDLDGTWGTYAERRLLLVSRGLATGEPGAARVAEVGRSVGQVLDLLEQLRREDGSADPKVRDAAQAMKGEQSTLSERLADAQRDAERVAQEMSVTPRRMLEELEQASERMKEGMQALGRGEPMQAQGSQEAAAQHVREALEALEQAGAASQSQEPGKGKGGKGGATGDEKSGQEKGGDEEEEGMGPIELPEPEEFRTPEEYRQALLEGMEGDVPEAYRILARRYYEELVQP